MSGRNVIRPSTGDVRHPESQGREGKPALPTERRSYHGQLPCSKRSEREAGLSQSCNTKVNKPFHQFPQASLWRGDSFTSFLPCVWERLLPSANAIVAEVFCRIQRGTSLYLNDANKTESGSLPGEKGVRIKRMVRQINNKSKNPVKTAITKIKSRRGDSQHVNLV
jgi:hypothetical protein